MHLVKSPAQVVLLVSCALALASCGTSTPVGLATSSASPNATAAPYNLPLPGEITGLHVLRMSDLGNRVSPFEKTSTDVAKVRRFYAAMLLLKPFPPHWAANCPIDVGVSYRLDFLRNGGLAVQAIFAGGCPGIAVQHVELQVVDSEGFTQLLAESLHVSASQVGLAPLDTAPPGGPFAPPSNQSNADNDLLTKV